MKYRNLDLSFSIEDIEFTILSICLEKLVKPIPMHSHGKDSYEIHYVSYGYGTLHLSETSYEIVPGTLFITGPQVEHEQISNPTIPMTEYCVYMKVKPSVKAMRGGSSLILDFLQHSFWFGSCDNSIHELMKQTLSELEKEQKGYRIVLQALLEQFIVQIARGYQIEESHVHRGVNGSPSDEDLIYLIIEEAFLYHYKDITLEALAAQIGLGRRQTERLLQMHYHKTFLQKKTAARMSAACSLLRDTSLSISSIAENLGYSSVEHFSTAFKKCYHMTPSAFRKRRMTVVSG